jgi:hypothetical protein
MSIYAASTPFGVRLVDDGALAVTDQSADGYRVMRAKYRADCDHFAVVGYEKPELPEVPEPDRPGSRLTHPGKSDQDVRLAQFIRITGMRGVSVLNAGDFGKWTANGSATRNVPNDVSGLPPVERKPVPVRCEDETISEPEVRQLRRYRNAMKGEKFAASMLREQTERSRAYWRAALPFWPLDKAGRFEAGKRRVNPDSGRDTLRFLDGSYLDDRIAAHQQTHKDECEQIESKREREVSRAAELRELVDMQAADDAEFDGVHGSLELGDW